MKHAVSKYPVGAKWEYKDANRTAYIHFARILNNIEVWNYGVYYHSDGSGHKFDWTTSYQLAKKNHFITGRFKRIK